MDIVNSILNDTNSGQTDLKKSTDVQKEIELDIDVGLLLASDYNPLDTKLLKTDSDAYLKSLTRDNVQLLINNIWNLPTETVDEAIVAKLPAPTYILPRSRCIPKPKPLTKWEQFAKEKGIKTKKRRGRNKLKWDEELGKWIPTFGKERAKQAEQKEWLVEVNSEGKALEDPFAIASAAKKERVAKNELQRLRNIARAKKIPLPQAPLPATENSFPSSKRIKTAVGVAKASTASVGKFQSKLPKEKEVRGPDKEFVPGTKGRRERKASIPSNIGDENRRNIETAENLLRKRHHNVLNDESIVVTPKAKKAKQSKGRKKLKPAAAAAAKRGKRSKISAGRKRR